MTTWPVMTRTSPSKSFVFDQDLHYWLSLHLIEGIGPATFLKLIEHFGSPRQVFEASDLSVLSSKPDIVTQIQKKSTFAKADQALQVLSKKNIHVLKYTDNDYPNRLKQISNFPPLLFAQGDVTLFNKMEWLGVVGSRRMSEYGSRVIGKLIPEIVAANVGIVSGFALGVDIEAHLRTIRSGGKTIGVFGSGLGMVHPSSHLKYVDEVLKNGVLVSEFPYDTPAHPGNFPRRNRIISGIARGILVIEAAQKSGALITAEYALEHNRDVYAVPGSIFSEMSIGSNLLIKQGAKVVNCGGDILNDWQYEAKISQTLRFDNPDEKLIHELCLQGVKTPDDLISQTQMSAEKLTMLLTQMELKGQIKVMSGRRYIAS